MTTKLLTGEHIYQTFTNHRMAYRPWNDMLPATRALYDDIAKELNEDLNLCGLCGERPVDPNCMLEVAGDNVCLNCCTHPIDPTDTKVQYMHMVFNPNGELAGVITPPAGMSLEDYKKQLAEEMSHISFHIQYENFDCKHAQATVKTIPELSVFISEHTSRDLPEKGKSSFSFPVSSSHHIYSVEVLKDNKKIGLAEYYRAFHTDQIIGEDGAAEGLLDAIKEYEWNQRMVEGSTIL